MLLFNPSEKRFPSPIILSFTRRSSNKFSSSWFHASFSIVPKKKKNCSRERKREGHVPLGNFCPSRQELGKRERIGEKVANNAGRARSPRFENRVGRTKVMPATWSQCRLHAESIASNSLRSDRAARNREGVGEGSDRRTEPLPSLIRPMLSRPWSFHGVVGILLSFPSRPFLPREVNQSELEFWVKVVMKFASIERKNEWRVEHFWKSFNLYFY